MRFIFLTFFAVILITGCSNSKSQDFKNYLVGDWRIENKFLQTYIRFEVSGKTTYFGNRYSYELDSLVEYGRWKLNEVRKGQSIDTFVVEIVKQPQETIFKFIPLDENRIKAFDGAREVLFKRITN